MKINMSIDEFNQIIKSDEPKARFKANMKKYGFDVDQAMRALPLNKKARFDTIEKGSQK